MTVAAPDAFLQAVESRRSYYNLTAKSNVSDEQLREIVEAAIKHVPSSFNSQTSRAVLVLGAKHRELWDKIWDAHSPNLTTPEDQKTYKDKFENAYKPGYGTVVFFEDQEAIDNFVKAAPIVQYTIDRWSANTSGMAQFIVWTDLATHGMGANLQHYSQYSPANQEAITKFLGVPNTWVATAQLVFGVPSGGPGNPAHPKTFIPIEERVKVVA